MNKKEDQVETRNNLFLQGIYPYQKADTLMKSFTRRQYGYEKAMVACRYHPLVPGEYTGFKLLCSIESPEGKVCIPHSEINQVIKDLVRYKEHFEIPDKATSSHPKTQDRKLEDSLFGDFFNFTSK